MSGASQRSEAAKVATGGVIVGIIAIWVATGVGGCQVGEADRPSADRAVQTAVGIGFAVPHGLLAAAAPARALAALGIYELRAYAPGSDPTQGSVTVGTSTGTGPTLLGAAAARLAGAPSPRVQEVGRYVAVHETGAIAGQEASVYSFPTAAGEVVVLCLGGEARTPIDQRDCTALASSLSISSEYGNPISLHELSAYPSHLAAALAGYLRFAPRLRRELRSARHAGEQAAVAGRLATACRAAASALARLAPTPIALPAQYALEHELDSMASGYVLLGQAARGGERRRWAAGGIHVAAAERQLRLSLAAALVQ